ncbi:MAG: hypothetical protein ACREO5_01010 [Candidatus Binatia bacterium]
MGIPVGLKFLAVLADGPIVGRTGGVVAHESAHIEGVASKSGWFRPLDPISSRDD